MKKNAVPDFFSKADWERLGELFYWVNLDDHRFEVVKELGEVNGPIFARGIIYRSADRHANGEEIFILDNGPIIKRWGLSAENQWSVRALIVDGEWFHLAPGESLDYELEFNKAGGVDSVEISVVDCDKIELTSVLVTK